MDELIQKTKKLGFNDVDAFHIVNGGEIPKDFLLMRGKKMTAFASQKISLS